MTTPRFCFDLESCPIPSTELPPFNPDSVKLGNLKDPAKIAEKLKEAERSYVEDSALYAERGRVLAIGYKWTGWHDVAFLEGDERSILEAFLTELSKCELAIKKIGGVSLVETATVCGFNILGFDLPFIRRRCLILGIPFPLYDRTNKWKPWNFQVFDAMVDWQCGNRETYISLDTLSRALGGKGKTGKGADFAKLYESDREAALEYLTRDVEEADFVCERMMR